MELMSKSIIPTPHGNFTIYAYGDHVNDPMPNIALIHEKTSSFENVLVRIHSECMTGDVFSSMRCECGAQLRKSFEMVASEGGIIIYLRQEGRGIGLIDKLKAYELQDKGLNTVEANLELGHASDERNFDQAVAILRDLKITSIRLLTNNPNKIKAIEESEIVLKERVPLIITLSGDNKTYMETKRRLLGHMLD